MVQANSTLHIHLAFTHKKPENINFDPLHVKLIFSLLTVVAHRVAANIGHTVAVIQSNIHRKMRRVMLMVRIIRLMCRMIVIRVVITCA